MERPHDPRPTLPDDCFQLGGLEVLLNVHVGKAPAGKAPQERNAFLLGAVILSPVLRAAHGEDHGKAGQCGQATCGGQFRVNEVVRAQLHEIHPVAQGFQAPKVCLEGFGGEDQADPGRGAESAGYRGAQKSLRYT